jgi:hypothetical protein
VQVDEAVEHLQADVHRRGLRRLPAVLTVEVDEERALLAVASAWRRVESFDWPRFLVGWCALFHAAAAVVLLTFRHEQLLTPATSPVFDLAGQHVWAFLFLGGAVSLVALWFEDSRPFGLVVLVGVLLIGGAWMTTFLLAVVRDSSSPLALVLWFFFYVPCLLGIGSRASGKR